MANADIDLALAKGHVREFEIRVEHQEKIVAELITRGRHQEARLAEELLTNFRTTLYAAREHLRVKQKRASRSD